MNNPILTLEQVSKSFYQGGQELKILTEVNFTLNAGDMVALVGPSGSGKSTLLQIAGLLDKVDSGKIYIEGKECSQADDKMRTYLRNNDIGFVYQFHHLLPDFTALENVMLPLLIAGKKENIAKKNALEILDLIGLKDRAIHLPSELSGGEQQRVAIARALINSPALLLADEPTGNLDPHTSDQVFALLLQAVKQLGLAALVVTHNHELASKMNKRITIKDGKLVSL